MSKIGVNLSIDVTQIDKEKLIKHENGKIYLNMTAFIDPDNPGNYGDHGMITQSLTKEERDADANAQGAILGNAKVFWQDDSQPSQQQAPKVNPQEPTIDFDDDIPF